MSYWEQYKREKPGFAAQIMALGLDFSEMADNDVREKCFALETTANDSNCSIADLKDAIMSQVMNNITEWDDSMYLLLLETWNDASKTEAKKYNLAPKNTIFGIAQEWVMERIFAVEKKRTNLRPRTTKPLQTLLLQFELESSEPILSLIKTHIYTKNFPMTPRNERYSKSLEEDLDYYFENRIGPFASNPNNRKNPQLYKLMLSSQVFMHSDKLKNSDDIDDIISECNEHYLSFYAEIDLAAKRIEDKYLD